MWEKGKVVKSNTSKFEPGPQDLPVISVPKKAADVEDTELGQEMAAAQKKDADRLATLGWQATMMRYVRMSPDEARAVGMLGEEEWTTASDADDYLRGGQAGRVRVKSDLEKVLEAAEETHNTAEEQEIKDAEDLGGTHFKNSPVLYAAYSYVTSAAQIFEARLKKDGGEVDTNTKNGDFENVFHCVMDAVEMYNDKWEQEVQLEMRQREEAREARSHQAWRRHGPDGAFSDMAALSDREKKDIQMEQHRSEIAARRHGGTISMGTETKIAIEVTKIMSDELVYLLFQDSSQPITKSKKKGEGRRNTIEPITPRASMNGGNRFVDKRQQQTVIDTVARSDTVKPSGTRSNSVVSFSMPGQADIFDGSPKETVESDSESDRDFLEKIKTHVPGRWNAAASQQQEDTDDDSDSDASLVASNEFAAEVLYIIQQSQGYCTLEKTTHYHTQ
jgi:hypothetical protein